MDVADRVDAAALRDSRLPTLYSVGLSPEWQHSISLRDEAATISRLFDGLRAVRDICKFQLAGPDNHSLTISSENAKASAEDHVRLNASMYVHERQQPRDVVDSPGTLRDQNDLPVDIVIEDISLTGFKCRCDEQVRLDTFVRVGLPGVGMRFARSVWQQKPLFGFEFTAPINMAQLSAIGSPTLIHARFPGKGLDSDPVSNSMEALVPKWGLPVVTRLALIIGASGVLWLALAAAFRQLLI